MEILEYDIKQNQNQIIALINESNDLDTLRKIRSAITKILWEEAKIEVEKVSKRKNITPEIIKEYTGIDIA